MEKVEEDVENNGIQMNEIREVEKKSGSNDSRNKILRNVSRWFVSHQKLEKWNENKLNTLQVVILLSLTVMYICHQLERFVIMTWILFTLET